jgi:hypothetical protein
MTGDGKGQYDLEGNMRYEYQIFYDASKSYTWAEAERYCRHEASGAGAHLAQIQNAADHKAVYLKMLDKLKELSDANGQKLRSDGTSKDIQLGFWIGLHDQLYERGFASERSPHDLQRGESARKNWQWANGQVGGGYVRWEEFPSATLRNLTSDPDARLWQERLALAAMRGDAAGAPYSGSWATGYIGDTTGKSA